MTRRRRVAERESGRGTGAGDDGRPFATDRYPSKRMICPMSAFNYLAAQLLPGNSLSTKTCNQPPPSEARTGGSDIHPSAVSKRLSPG
ncbi:unnamed protein product [Brassica napus]|uniref:(rape) hypothetical protein n=1 Tax=Brassica napus TaxID=3708 RepID=A0A817B6H5_BRANA|nr:unnamed protein product [Brassica napus]